MTPNELLTNVTSTISHLVYDDEAALNALLKQTLQVYEENAGVKASISIPADQIDSIALPEDYLKFVTATDSTLGWVPVREIDNGLQIIADDDSEGPYTLTYLVQLSALDLETGQIPASVGTSVLFDYLLALVEIRNNEALRRVYVSGGMDASGLMMPAELRARLDEARANMKSRRAVLPMVTVR